MFIFSSDKKYLLLEGLLCTYLHTSYLRNNAPSWEYFNIKKIADFLYAS